MLMLREVLGFTDSRCSVPECNGASPSLTRQDEESLCQAFLTGSARTMPRIDAARRATILVPGR